MTRIIVAAAALGGVAAYWFIGKPGMPDSPLTDRLAEIEAQAATSAETLRGDQMMALIQKRAQEAPEDPLPHKFMGDLLAAAGSPNEAILAYQSALRRDPDHAPALRSLADLLFKMSGRVDAATRDLYLHAFQLTPDDLRVGYMAGVGMWQAGNRAEAESLWASIEAKTPDGDPRLQMFQAIRETFATDAANPAESPAEPTPSPGQ